MAIHEQLLAAVGDRRGVGAADRLCEACVVLFGVDAATISLVFDGTNVGTLGASGVSARVYDELQFTLGEGPCLDSVAHRAPVVVVDLADPDVVRWPAYGPAMLADQIRGVYAMPVVAGQYVGALGLFGTAVGELNDADRLVAQTLAHIACVAILQDHPATPATVLPHLHAALTSRIVVDQAKGFLSQRLEVSVDDAFTLLRRHARTHGDHLTELSRRLITEPEARQTILAAMTQMMGAPPS